MDFTVVSGTVTVTGGQDFTADAPEITTQPEAATYTYGDATAEALSVAARVTDEGTLSYQWYSNTSDSTTGGTAITGETDTVYTPKISAVGTTYYYCVVTNTINGATASATSNTAAVTVKALDISSSATVTVSGTYTYTGSAIEPNVTVTLDGTVLTAGTDYTVAYTNNTNAGTATATVTFTGNYTGSASATFEIDKADQTLTVTTAKSIRYTTSVDLRTLVSGNQGELTFTLTEANGFTLADDGYTLTAPETTGVSATVTVSADEATNYNASSDYTITVTSIDKTDVSSAITFVDGSATYTGEEQSIAEATIESGYTGSFTYSYALDGQTLTGLPVDAGTYTVTATYEDDENMGTAEATFTIEPKEIAASDFDVDTADEDYTGEAVTKAIESALIENTDYTVTYENNTGIGEAAITINGIGNYTGELTYTFNIVGVAVTGVTLDESAVELTVGDTLTLTATVTPENASDPTVTWKSGKASVASVDENGVVTGAAAGTATIT
ncbi:MAG: Ig-like domain-containing protein, partial [Oscillospiraceae bacterium]|nr:Ig-like domain-containing protein [Oscillospiraceae bacterium]